MKSLKILIALCTVFAFSEAQAQYVAVYKSNGSVKQYSMEEVDSIVFYEKEQIINPQNPDDNHGSDNNTDVAVTGGTSNVSYSSVTVNCYANVPNDGETYVIGVRYSTEQDLTDSNSTITKRIETNASKGNHSFTFELKDLDNSLTYYYQTYVQLYSNQQYYYGETLSFTPKAINLTIGEAIDMGVSVKWASSNLGADQPEQDGGYYAYGELGTKDSYFPDNYKYYDSSTYEFLYLGDVICGEEAVLRGAGVDVEDAAYLVFPDGGLELVHVETREIGEKEALDRQLDHLSDLFFKGETLQRLFDLCLYGFV